MPHDPRHPTEDEDDVILRALAAEQEEPVEHFPSTTLEDLPTTPLEQATPNMRLRAVMDSELQNQALQRAQSDLNRQQNFHPGTDVSPEAVEAMGRDYMQYDENYQPGGNLWERMLDTLRRPIFGTARPKTDWDLNT